MNIQNDDVKCFLWSVLAHQHPAKNNISKVPSYEKFGNKLNVYNISWLVKEDKIRRFEENINLKIVIAKAEKLR